MAAATEPGLLALLAATIGTSEAALRLLTVLLLGIPLSAIYNVCFAHHSLTLKHAYFFISGLSLAYFGFGLGCFHLLTTILGTYVLLLLGDVLQKRVLATALVFLFTMTYLLWGYVQFSTDSYDVDWTTPHCVLTLRLIGLAFDLQDGQKRPEKKTQEQGAAASNGSNGSTSAGAGGTVAPAAAAAAAGGRPSKDALSAVPGLLDVLGFCFCFCGMTAGPQYSFRLYRAFVDGSLVRSTSGRLTAGLSRLGLGLLYIGVVAVAIGYFPDTGMFTPSFYEDTTLFERMAIIFFTGKFNLMKYIGVWLLNETSCIFAGISYNEVENPKTKAREVRWDGVSNCYPLQFETTISLKGVIQSFNINTNQWVLNYIFKRLRFLGNKDLSQLGALIFLAVWHGYYIGFFLTFGLEFVTMQAENGLKERFSLPQGVLRYPALLACWLVRNMIMSYSMISFIGKDWARSHATSASVYYFVHVLAVAALVLCRFVPKQKVPVEPITVEKKRE